MLTKVQLRSSSPRIDHRRNTTQDKKATISDQFRPSTGLDAQWEAQQQLRNRAGAGSPTSPTSNEVKPKKCNWLSCAYKGCLEAMECTTKLLTGATAVAIALFGFLGSVKSGHSNLQS